MKPLGHNFLLFFFQVDVRARVANIHEKEMKDKIAAATGTPVVVRRGVGSSPALARKQNGTPTIQRTTSSSNLGTSEYMVPAIARENSRLPDSATTDDLRRLRLQRDTVS